MEENMKMRKSVTLLLVVAMLTATFTSCGDGTEKETETIPVNNSETTETVETEEVDPFASVDLDGVDIRMMVSDREIDGMASSITAIQHGDELTGEVVSDAVYNRNMMVEELLNMNLSFTANPDTETEIPTTIKQLITAGDDAYELIIHELFPLATLSVSNHFITSMTYPIWIFPRSIGMRNICGTFPLIRIPNDIFWLVTIS